MIGPRWNRMAKAARAAQPEGGDRPEEDAPNDEEGDPLQEPTGFTCVGRWQ